MKTKKYIFPALPIILMALTSCTNDFLDLKPLDTETDAVYFKSPEQFEALANNLHTCIYSWNGNTSYSIRHDYGTDLVTIGLDAVNGTNSTPTSDTYYTQTYKWLRTVNQLIDHAKEYSNISEISGSVGQAYFFRAWHHFFLLQRYGGIALMLETPGIESDMIWGPRNSRYEVVASILNDLDTAIDLLKNTTVSSTNNDGHVTIEAAKAFKARVCLYEGTWEKYNGIGSADATNGNGSDSGAGTSMPDNYPSIDQMLVMARDLSEEIIDSGSFELFLGVESAENSANPALYAHKSYFYLFNLEGPESNPAGMSKADNKEAIFRSVFDHTNRKSNTNLTHTEPARMSRKLMDMYLCSDGLPIHVSPLFQGFVGQNAEFENRDYRLTACHPQAGEFVWGWGKYGTGADYSLDITTLAAATYQYWPDMTTNSSVGTRGRKFCSELSSVADAGQEAMDCMHIRLAEIYLIYAEAICELGNGAISDADLDKSINKVRARGGVAPLNAALIAQAKALGCDMTFLGEIRRERAVELYGEGLRIPDCTRWGIAEKVFSTPICGMYANYKGENTWIVGAKNPNTQVDIINMGVWAGNINEEVVYYEDPAYTPTEAGALIATTKANRRFTKKNYLQPIPSDEIQLNENLLQNPGW